MTYCRCGKASYATRQEAAAAVRGWSRRRPRKGHALVRAGGRPLGAYRCPTARGLWHVGHELVQRTERTR